MFFKIKLSTLGVEIGMNRTTNPFLFVSRPVFYALSLFPFRSLLPHRILISTDGFSGIFQKEAYNHRRYETFTSGFSSSGYRGNDPRMCGVQEACFNDLIGLL